jgi:pantothenate kinase
VTYTTYINIGTHLTAEWKIDRKYKTLEQAQAREKLLLEHYEVMILEGVKPQCQSSSIRT